MAKILVIDDDKSILSVFKMFLTRLGHHVSIATNGREGMEQLTDVRPDLIITDIMMPEMDGLEFLLELQKQASDLPIIAISGGTRDLPVNFLRQAKLFGARQILEKPVTLQTLEQAVQVALATHG